MLSGYTKDWEIPLICVGFRQLTTRNTTCLKRFVEGLRRSPIFGTENATHVLPSFKSQDHEGCTSCPSHSCHAFHQVRILKSARRCAFDDSSWMTIAEPYRPYQKTSRRFHLFGVSRCFDEEITQLFLGGFSSREHKRQLYWIPWHAEEAEYLVQYQSRS